MTRVFPCSCTHIYQDRKYGKGKRVHNQTTKDNKVGWRCTVCSKERK